MELVVRKNDLLRELQLFQGIVERKNTIPILANVLMEAKGGHVSFLATDLEVGLRSKCEATVTKPGSLTLPAKKFYEIVKSLPETDIRIAEDKGGVKIAADRFDSRMQTLPREDFPTLKILVSHGGGAIPYQIGRFDATTVPRNGMSVSGTRFRDRFRKLYFDTVLYSREAIELLIKVAGPSQCLYGAEMPGVGSAIDPETGRTFDTLIPHIRECSFISQADRSAILGGNAARLFRIPA